MGILCKKNMKVITRDNLPENKQTIWKQLLYEQWKNLKNLPQFEETNLYYILFTRM